MISKVLALQNDKICLSGDMVDPQFLDTLTEAEDIDVANVLRNGYGYVTLNTDKYPMNITAFRRALAFAVDKERISDDVWDGLSVPQDSPVPQVNPFSIEGQLPYTYYEANVELRNQMLDDAGFLDVDDDGIREAPNGEDFDILIECAQSSSIAIEVGQVVAAALQELGVDARSIPTDFYEYLQRLYYHGDYDIVFLGSSFNNFDVNWLAESYNAETHEDDPAVPDGYTRITFDILQNATWTDSTPITAEDIAFSLNYFRDAPGNIYGNDLTEMTAAYAPTTYSLIVEFDTESYWHLHTIGYKPIIPKHVFEEVGVNAWNQYNPVPPEDAMVTSGPFNVSDYVAGEFTEMTRFEDYFYAFDCEPIGPEGPGISSNLALAIIAGAVGAAVVILIGGYILMRQ